MDFDKTDLEEEVIVSMKDFDTALKEIKPAFGMDQDKIDVYLRNGVIDYGPKFKSF